MSNEVFRIARADDNGDMQLAGDSYTNGLKKLYPTRGRAKLALQHFPRGSVIQRGVVESWETIE